MATKLPLGWIRGDVSKGGGGATFAPTTAAAAAAAARKRPSGKRAPSAKGDYRHTTAGKFSRGGAG